MPALPELKRYYRERWMSIKGLDAFYGAQDALLEQAIYDGVAGGTVRNADDLDKSNAGDRWPVFAVPCLNARVAHSLGDGLPDV